MLDFASRKVCDFIRARAVLGEVSLVDATGVGCGMLSYCGGKSIYTGEGMGSRPSGSTGGKVRGMTLCWESHC